MLYLSCAWCLYLVTAARSPSSSLFFFNDTATTEIYTLSLHDALPIFFCAGSSAVRNEIALRALNAFVGRWLDRKSTRLNSSHMSISYAVFCLKKKKQPTSQAPPSLDTPAGVFPPSVVVLSLEHVVLTS